MARYEEKTPIDVLVPYDKNPRIISQAAVDAVARSIKAFNFNEPILVDENGVIIAGHNRLKAAKQLGLTEVPVLWLDELDMQKARAFRIADNRTAELAEWDRGLLDKELEGLIAAGTDDLDALGVEQWELDRLSKDAEQITPDGYLPDRLYKKKCATDTDSDDGEGRPVETAPKAPAKPLSPPSIRILIIMETDEDKAAARRALGIADDQQIPAVIRFSEVKS